MKSVLVGPPGVRFTGNEYPVLKVSRGGLVVRFTKKNCGVVVHNALDMAHICYPIKADETKFETLKGQVILAN